MTGERGREWSGEGWVTGVREEGRGSRERMEGGRARVKKGSRVNISNSRSLIRVCDHIRTLATNMILFYIGSETKGRRSRSTRRKNDDEKRGRRMRKKKKK